MTTLIDPDCAAGKHTNCDGTGWEDELDCPAPCPCPCHTPSETHIHLVDVDNRDDTMRPHEFVGDVDMIVAYLDGPLRSDLTHPIEDAASLDEAIAAVRAGDIRLADAIVHPMSVALTTYPTTLRETIAARNVTA